MTEVRLTFHSDTNLSLWLGAVEETTGVSPQTRVVKGRFSEKEIELAEELGATVEFL